MPLIFSLLGYSKIHLLSKSEILSLWPSSVVVQPGLCLTWSEAPKAGFLTTPLILYMYVFPEEEIRCVFDEI